MRINIWLNEGGALSNQQTDRLLINGDVSGKTLIIVNEVAGSPGGSTGSGRANEGISIVQVEGAAQEDSFVLKGGYVAMNSQPYRYELMAYGPGAANGTADPSQRLIGVGLQPHWDYRLQNEYAAVAPPPVTPPPVTPPPVTPPPVTTRPPIRAIVPQLPSYLTAHRALFKSIMNDLRNMHRRLNQIRRGSDSRYRLSFGPLSASDQDSLDRGVFLRAYGGDYDYTSNLGAAEYGVDATIRQSALQGGGTLYALEGAGSLLEIGLAGSVGDLNFSPHEIDGANRTKLDQWSITPSLSWRSHQGAYLDAVIAHGSFKGGVSTMQRGETARLKGTTLAASLETGYPIAFGSVTLEPQVQVAWQRLKFDTVQDVDGFPVQLGDPSQWTVRAGGELNKALFPSSGRHMRLYGRVHVSHSFGDDNQVWLGDAFQLSRAGNSLETSLGLDATLLGGKTTFYTDITRQQRLGNEGMQGWSANMGVQVGF